MFSANMPELLAADFEAFLAGQADNRIPAPFFPALNRFEQVAPGPVSELAVDAQRGVEIGKYLACERNAVVSLSVTVTIRSV